MSFADWPIEDLKTLALAGAGFAVNGEPLSTPALRQIALAACLGKATVCFTNMSGRSLADIKGIALDGGGSVSFRDKG